MINYLNSGEIDKKKWDQCIQQSPYELIYAYSWYLDIVCPAWEALIIGDYEAVFPLTPLKKWGIPYIEQPFFCQQLGLFSKAEIRPSELQEILKNIPKKFLKVNINLHSGCKTSLEKINYELNLNKHYEDLSGQYSNNQKRNITKAGKSGINITSTPAEYIIGLHQENISKKTPELKPFHYETLKKLIKKADELGKIEINAAFNPMQEILAGIIFLKHNNRHIYLLAASNEMGKQIGTMSYLIDHHIQKYAEREITLDFEGSSIPSLARFYAGFGARQRNYFQYKRNYLPFISV